MGCGLNAEDPAGPSRCTCDGITQSSLELVLAQGILLNTEVSAGEKLAYVS